MNLYTRSILAVIAMAVLLNASNPSSQPIAQWAELHRSVNRIENQIVSVSSSIMAIGILINTSNPWGKPIVSLVKHRGRSY